MLNKDSKKNKKDKDRSTILVNKSSIISHSYQKENSKEGVKTEGGGDRWGREASVVITTQSFLWRWRDVSSL